MDGSSFLLKLVLGVAIGMLALGAPFGGNASAVGAAYLTHGPITGGVTDSSARVFMRTNVGAQVEILYGTREDMSNARNSTSVSTGPEADYTAQVDLMDLKANTVYFLRAQVDGVVQGDRPAQFKTFPPVGREARLKLLILTDFASIGTGNQPPLSAPAPTFASAARENPDLVLIGGDFDHRLPRTLEEKRQMFKDLYAPGNPRAPMDDFVRLILPRFALAHQWDDHDYSSNDSDRLAPDRLLARQVYDEFFPAYPHSGEPGIYQTFHYGNIDFFMLDNRSERDPDNWPNTRGKSMLDGEKLGQGGQLAWLKRGLEESRARWKVILSSSVFNTTVGKIDSWHGFRYEHDAIVKFVRDRQIRGVFVLSGDMHAGALDDGRDAGLPEMVSPGPNLAYCSTAPQNAPGLWSHGRYGRPARERNAQPCNGYGVVVIKHDRAKLVVKDTTGRTRLRMNLRSNVLPR